MLSFNWIKYIFPRTETILHYEELTIHSLYFITPMHQILVFLSVQDHKMFHYVYWMDNHLIENGKSIPGIAKLAIC